MAEEGCQDGQGQPPGEGQQTEVILQGPRAIEGVWEPGPLVWLYLEMGPLRQLSRLHKAT